MYFFLLVFQWNLICDKANIAATVQSLFVAGMMAGSLSFGAISDFFGRRFCLFLCSALAVSIRDQRINRQSKLLSLLSWFNFAFLCSVRLQSSIVGLNFVTRYQTNIQSNQYDLAEARLLRFAPVTPRNQNDVSQLQKREMFD